MEKISPKKAIELCKSLDRFSYFANPFYLAANCFWESRNGEDLVFEKDGDSDSMVLMFLPKKKENMVGQRISTAYEDDLVAVKRAGLNVVEKKDLGIEYIYRTEDFVSMAGGHFKTFRKEVGNFQKKFQFKILNDYPNERVIEFMRRWHDQKDLSGKSDLTKQIFEADFRNCIDYLDMRKDIPNKGIFIEMDGKLIGFQVMAPMRNDLWIALMQKVETQYRGLTKLLYHLPAIEMRDVEFFTTGAEAQDPKLAEFKESINPVKKLVIFDIKITND